MTITWDGLDNSGGRAPAGKYYLRIVDQTGKAVTGKAIIVR